MKPFNLKEALAGKAVKLRDGRKAYVRHHETELDVNSDYRLLGYDSDGEQLSWHENGSYLSARATSDRDIIGMYPETRLINGFEVPAPETKPLTDGIRYYVPSPIHLGFYDEWRWSGCDFDLCILERGMVFLNANDAIANAKAMLGIDPHSKAES